MIRVVLILNLSKQPKVSAHCDSKALQETVIHAGVTASEGRSFGCCHISRFYFIVTLRRGTPKNFCFLFITGYILLSDYFCLEKVRLLFIFTSWAKGLCEEIISKVEERADRCDQNC